MDKILELVVKTTGIAFRQVANTVELLEGGATIPFISRYRKERTGGLDEVEVEKIQKQHSLFTELSARKESILNVIEKQGFLTEDLKKQIDSTWNLNELEDIYLPYKPKRKTRASVAKEKGLEPLAEIISRQQNIDIEKLAASFLNNDVKTIEEALQGANDIIAEKISENKQARERIRNLFAEDAVISSKVVKSKMEEAEKYRDYFDFSQKLATCPSHRILAIRRGEIV